ncbi:MAG: hypothetical protein EOO68_17620 [Moraxellaceae bacterium]|nr:MAG: hypothetical protein EOO68_17620 [Moraxellaceae bacterium]
MSELDAESILQKVTDASTKISGASFGAFFYNKIKGELEQAVEQLRFERLSIFQPSLLLGEHQDARLAENLAQKAFSVIKPVLTQTWKYRPIEAERVAQAMCIAATLPAQAKVIYSNTDLLTLTLENPA